MVSATVRMAIWRVEFDNYQRFFGVEKPFGISSIGIFEYQNINLREDVIKNQMYAAVLVVAFSMGTSISSSVESQP